MALKAKSRSKSKSSATFKARRRAKLSRSSDDGTLTKRDRLEARVSSTQKKLINKAAALQGRSVSDFMIATLDKEARKIVHDYEALEFSLKEKEAFITALEKPPIPSENLIRAFERLAYIDHE